MAEMRTIAIGDLCTHCGRDTSAGGGLWVNRIPSLADAESANGWYQDWQKTDLLDGWMCVECQAYECEFCEQPVFEDEESNSEVGHFHIACLDKVLFEKILARG